MIKKIWNRASHIGLEGKTKHTDWKYIVFANQVVFVMSLTVLLLDLAFWGWGIERAGWLLISMLICFGITSLLIKNKHYNAGRIFGLSIQNLHLLLFSIFIGYEARVIDFLIITTFLPLVLFNVRQKNYIILCAIQGFLYFSVYHALGTNLQMFELPVEQQMAIYYMTIPVKFILVVLIVLILVNNGENELKENARQHNELLSQKNYFTSVMDQVPIDIATFDKDMRYTYVNHNGIKDGEVKKWIIGKTDFDYAQLRNMDPSFAVKRHAMFKAALSTGNICHMDEVIVDRTGRERVTMKGAAPIRDHTGEISGVVAFSMDITERKEAEDNLKSALADMERVNDGLKQFAFVTSHDLKTPLRNISTYLQLLKRKNNLDVESNDMIERAVKSVKHLNQLISDIFLYTTNDFRNKSSEQVDLNEVLQSVRNDTFALVKEKNAALEVPDNLPNVYVNRTQAIHVFSNLVSNALKYNKSEQPKIEVQVGKINGFTEFRVKDNGIGIAPQYKDKIFEIFKRLHTHEEYEGTGIGLAICKKIVESYGGKIEVESEPGKGSEFIFTLPTQPH